MLLFISFGPLELVFQPWGQFARKALSAKSRNLCVKTLTWVFDKAGFQQSCSVYYVSIYYQTSKMFKTWILDRHKLMTIWPKKHDRPPTVLPLILAGDCVWKTGCLHPWSGRGAQRQVEHVQRVRCLEARCYPGCVHAGPCGNVQAGGFLDQNDLLMAPT